MGRRASVNSVSFAFAPVSPVPFAIKFLLELVYFQRKDTIFRCLVLGLCRQLTLRLQIYLELAR